MRKEQQKIIWLYGLSGSGKSTLAQAYLKENKDQPYVWLDGDDVRSGISKDLGFDLQDRSENIRRIAEIAKLLYRQNYSVLVSAITPLGMHRNIVLEILKDTNLKLIFCKCSIEACQKRDVKGLYKKANSLEILSFTGISSAFEEPSESLLVINTQNVSSSVSLQELMEELNKC